MPGQRMILTPCGASHQGPVTPDCLVECLQTVLSMGNWNPLARAYDAPFDPPRTVGDVLGLCAGRRLGEIRNVGTRRILEIEAALVLAGLDITGHPPQARKARGERA